MTSCNTGNPSAQKETSIVSNKTRYLRKTVISTSIVSPVSRHNLGLSVAGRRQRCLSPKPFLKRSCIRSLSGSHFYFVTRIISARNSQGIQTISESSTKLQEKSVPVNRKGRGRLVKGTVFRIFPPFFLNI